MRPLHDFFSYSFINPFQANIPISYPLKTPENLWFSGVFSGIHKMGALARNGLMKGALVRSNIFFSKVHVSIFFSKEYVSYLWVSDVFRGYRNVTLDIG